MMNNFYFPPVNFWSVWFSEVLIRFLHKNNCSISSSDVILDIGCGLGFHCFNLKSYSPKEIYGSDISEQTINLIKSFSKDILFQKMDICDDVMIDFHNKFSIIFSSDVYEHVPDPQKMLNNIYMMLKKKGVVCMTFPNEDVHGHNQIDSIQSIESQITEAGFREYKIEIITNISLSYRVFTWIYKILQNLSDFSIGVKRGPDRRPDSDVFHEMYAFKKIAKIKDKKNLIVIINILFSIMKRIGRMGRIYHQSQTSNNVKNARLLMFAKK